MSTAELEALAFLEGAEPTLSPKEASVTAYEGWRFNDNSFKDYCAYVSPAGVATLTRKLEAFDGEGSALDIAGGKNGKAVQDLVAAGLVQKGLFTNYLDKRSKETQQNPDLHHRHGNIFELDVWQQIFEWRRNEAPEGFSIVMHRPHGALQKCAPYVYREAAHLLLDHIRPGGVLLAQIPRPFIGIKNHFTELGKEAYRSLDARNDVESINISTVFRSQPMILVSKSSESAN